MSIYLLLTLFFLLLLLLAEKQNHLKVKAISKALASCGFLIYALEFISDWDTFSVGIFSGLVLSFFGDLFLISTKKKWFLSGLVAFLLAHVCYVLAFLKLGPEVIIMFSLAPILIIIAVLVFKWVSPELDKKMKMPVLAYISVISLMVITASGLWGFQVENQTGKIIILGAFLFFLSDLFVARQRFVKKEFFNKLVGLPLYYVGQLILAYSISRYFMERI